MGAIGLYSIVYHTGLPRRPRRRSGWHRGRRGKHQRAPYSRAQQTRQDAVLPTSKNKNKRNIKHPLSRHQNEHSQDIYKTQMSRCFLIGLTSYIRRKSFRFWSMWTTKWDCTVFSYFSFAAWQHMFVDRQKQRDVCQRHVKPPDNFHRARIFSVETRLLLLNVSFRASRLKCKNLRENSCCSVSNPLWYRDFF